MPIPVAPQPGQPVTINPGDWTGSLNGLAIGTGTPYEIAILTGWKTMKSLPLGGMSTGSGTLPAPKGTTNGAWPADYWMGAREVAITFNVMSTASTTFAEALALLEATTQPSGGGTDHLTLTLDGVTTTLYGRIADRDETTDLAYQFGWSTVPIMFTGFDPRRLAAALTGLTKLPSSIGGLTFPAQFPIQFTASQVTGEIDLTNTGNANGPLSLTVTGPCAGPIIAHRESGLTLAFSSALVIAAGDTLVIDCEAQTALYNGGPSRNAFIIQRGWPTFLPGSNTYSFNAATYNSTAQLAVVASPAYL